ncbi:hypothetical protein C8J57DRAFT_1532477 [Mycena rebaudengoi]|nr:hypothetical protein C8J57DRAFT_1532477 [Mycena rebaudengoi]
MDTLYLDAEGAVPVHSKCYIDADAEISPSWVGLNKNVAAIHPNSLACEDDLRYLQEGYNAGDDGLSNDLEWSLFPDWLRDTYEYRAFIPLKEERLDDDEPFPWYRLMRSTTSSMTVGEVHHVSPPEHEKMHRDLAKFQQYVDALRRSPAFNEKCRVPETFDASRLYGSFTSDKEMQIVCTQAKRSMLEMWGFMSWWTTFVPTWRTGVRYDFYIQIDNLRLSSAPKRGALISLRKDCQRLNIAGWLKQNVPLFYVWGVFEETCEKLIRLDPRILSSYRAEATSRGSLSLVGGEVPMFSEEMAKAREYDLFMDKIPEPTSKIAKTIPVESETSGCVIHFVQDFIGWARRKLANDENVETLAKLYHHIVVE